MSLFIASLNSGSNGNCYYVGDTETGILIDGGISCRETEKRLKRIGLSIRNIKAIFISHEHGDHVHGVSSLSKKHKLPIYITEKTFGNARIELADEFRISFKAHEPVTVAGLTITGFPKMHDAFDPHSFIVSNGTVTVGIFTDIGSACENVKAYFGKCHAAFLESNYDDDMLTRGGYPYYLKERIRGDRGHLSNLQAVTLFSECRAPFMSHLFLSHLSRDNNSPKIVKELFSKAAGNTQVIVASRDRQTPLYQIRNLEQLKPARPKSQKADHRMQISLFQ